MMSRSVRLRERHGPGSNPQQAPLYDRPAPCQRSLPSSGRHNQKTDHYEAVMFSVRAMASPSMCDGKHLPWRRCEWLSFLRPC